MNRKVLCSLAVMIAASLAVATPSAAQPYPDKPIRMIVPFPAGGPIDVMARLVGQQLTTGIGQMVVVENRPGAGGTIATKAAAGADPDGYTLLFGSTGSISIAPTLYNAVGYDPIKSFTAVAAVALLPHVLVVGPGLPVRNLQEFIAYARANPGKLNYGAGLGTPPHLLGTWFTKQAGIDAVYVPYKGSAQSITELLGGQTQFSLDGLTGMFPFIKDGKVRPLAVARATRWPALPDIPTLAESGFPDFVIDAWAGILAPAGTPDAIVSELNKATNDALQQPDVKASLARFSAIEKAGSAQEFAAFLANDVRLWSGLVKLTGAKAE